MEARTLLAVNSTLPVRELLDGFVPSRDYAANEVLIQFSDCSERPALASSQNKLAEVLERIDTRVATECGRGSLDVTALAPGVSVADALRSLRRDPAVQFAEPNWTYTREISPNDPYYTASNLWGMYGDATTPANQYGSKAGELWAAGYTGSRAVYVGVIDEGLQDDHLDLDANVWTNPFDPVDGIDNDQNGFIDDMHGWDFVNNDRSVYDGGTSGRQDTHGTHVAGTIGAEGNNSAGVVGVNWNVTMISAKFLGTSGGTTANAIRAVDYITDLKVRHGLNIVATNNSWGGGGFSQALLNAITRAAQQNILFIAAAGNSARNNDTTVNYPSNYNTTADAGYDAVIAVAAIQSNGGLASFSNYGATTVDLGAPGVSINSTLPYNRYGALSGTSMATPHVTGAAAIYASTHPGASALTIRNAILDAARATPTASLASKTVTGGRLNVSSFVANLVIGDVTQAEGTGSTATNFNVSVRLSAPSVEKVQVDYATADGTASAGSDYTAIPSTTLLFAPGQTAKTITVSVIADATSEPDEAFQILASNPTNASIVDGSGTAIVRNDDAAVSISDVAKSEGTSANFTPFTFTVSIPYASVLPVSVQYSTADDTASAGSDFVAVTPTLLKFLPGDTTKTVTVNVVADSANESAETFFVELSNAIQAEISKGRGIGTILNDDDATVTISVADIALAEGTSKDPMTATVSVLLSAPSSQTVTVELETKDGTAEAGKDYTGLATTVLTFAAGETAAHVNLHVTADATSEPFETFKVVLSDPTNAVLAIDQATVTLQNDDAEVTISDVTAQELTSPTKTPFVFTVGLTHATILPVEVDYATVDDSAKAPSDYTAIPATTISLPPGSTSKTITVAVTADDILEPDERFFVDVAATRKVLPDQAFDGSAPGTQTGGTGLIAVAQTFTVGTGGLLDSLTINVATRTADVIADIRRTTSNGTPEFDDNSVLASATLPDTAGVFTDLSVNVIGAGIAVASGDVLAIVLRQNLNGPGFSWSSKYDGNATYAGGAGYVRAQSNPWSLNFTTDQDFQSFVRIPTNVNITRPRAVGTIIDDDNTVSIGDVTRAEGSDGGTTAFDFTVTLGRPSRGVVTVDVKTTAGSATPGADYVELSGSTLLFGPGESSKTVSVLVNADAVSEPHETFTVVLSNPNGAVLADDWAIGTIQNDDAELTITDVSQPEGTSSNPTPFNFAVSLRHPSVLAVTVDATTEDGTALAGEDYSPLPAATLEFQPGVTTQTLRVDVTADSMGENAETFFVQLSNATNATLVKDRGVGTILNDDATISIDDVTKEEGTGVQTTFVFTVSLSKASALRITVDYFTEDGSALDQRDYHAKPLTTLVFDPGETSKTISIDIVVDKIGEPDENFFVRLENATNSVITDDTGEGTILNDDLIPPEL